MALPWLCRQCLNYFVARALVHGLMDAWAPGPRKPPCMRLGVPGLHKPAIPSETDLPNYINVASGLRKPPCAWVYLA
eukprot:1154265-Pelagomonas_calceolata.AAC.2